MHELYTFILGELRGSWRFRWYALLVAWVVAIAGAYVVLTMPDEYRVQSRVQVDTESMLQPLLRDLAVSQDLGTRVELLTNTLLSRDNLERIALESDLMVGARTEYEEQQVLDGLRNRININVPGRRSNVYNISYTSSDPQRSRQVVQSVLDIMMEQALGMQRTDSAAASDFLERQVEEYENRLRAAEQRLAEFKRENVGLLPEQGGRDYYQRLRAMEERLDEMESELRTVDNRRTALRQQIQQMEAGEAVQEVNNPRLQAMEEQLRESRNRLDELLLRYTDSHPDVLAMQDRIERQEAERDRLEAAPAATTSGDIGSNPVYQELQIRLNDQNSEAAALQTRIEDQERRIGNLRSQVDEITDVETRFADLTRDYNVTRERYQMLLGRLSTAQLSIEADASGNQVRFRLLDPPVAPAAASGPPRQMFLMALLPISLGVGGGFAFFLHQLRPVFQNRRLLGEITGRPVLGSVSLVMTRNQKRMKFGAVAVFGAAVLSLVAVIAVGVMFADLGADQLQTAVRRLGL
ncbi:MAG: hypothetical protein JJU06_22305 [Ectothiorhodospiraceae bacterium]|nr:hypothetical protein [Ectothiorhodospiraceae bacterium]